MQKKFSPSEVEAIFHKAAALDLQLKDSLSLEQLHEVAFESGISPEALELAIAEVEISPQVSAQKPKRQIEIKKQYGPLIATTQLLAWSQLGCWALHWVAAQYFFLESPPVLKALLSVLALFLESAFQTVSFFTALAAPFVLCFSLIPARRKLAKP